MKDRYNIDLSREDLLLIRRGLGGMPYDEVNHLIDGIAMQIEGAERMRAEAPPTPPEA
jgi:hypothetical protein